MGVVPGQVLPYNAYQGHAVFSAKFQVIDYSDDNEKFKSIGVFRVGKHPLR